jgi:hypothetical protein
VTCARALVARLTGYTVGGTKIAEFFADAGMTGPSDEGKDGWHVARLDAAGTQPAEIADTFQFRVDFRDPRGRDRSIANLEFKAGILVVFKWNN